MTILGNEPLVLGSFALIFFPLDLLQNKHVGFTPLLKISPLPRSTL